MAQSTLLRAKGLFSFQNLLSEVPEGALARADNVVIDREGVIEPRKGIKLYGTAMVGDSSRAKQLLKYKDRIIRHYNDKLEFDNGLGTFSAFSGSYLELEDGLRIKGLETRGNFFFTTKDGIKKISAASASQLSSASGFITDAGGVKATDVTGIVDFTNPGFFTCNSKVAYRVVWGIRDANNNVILGTPSERLVVTNPLPATPATSANTKLSITVPAGVTTNHFYQVYRTAVLDAGLSSLDEVDPGDEQQLIVEDFPSPAQITAGVVEYSDNTPESFRASGAFLYTNGISGEGILQANEPPPLAKDISSFKNVLYYANTSTRHKLTLDLLSVTDFVSGSHKFLVANEDGYQEYTFVGVPEQTKFTFDTQANTADGSYFFAYSASNERKYAIWFDKTGTTLEPTGVDLDNVIFVRVDISAATTASDVRAAVKTALDALDTGDFTYLEAGADLTIECTENGLATDATVGLVPPGGAFAIVVQVQGEGEGTSPLYVTLSASASVADAIETTAKSLCRVINKTMTSPVNAYYISGTDDIPGKIVLENKTSENVPFYAAISSSVISGKWNPALPSYTAITSITATNPAQVTSTGHGFVTGDSVYLTGTNSVPSVDGLYTITVIDANNFTIPVNLLGETAGTAGISFKADVDSDNEQSPNRLYYSKFQQPEAVPLLNYLDIGPKDEPIVRILGLRDSLIVFKTDGVYRLTAEVGAGPTVVPFDGSTVIQAADSAVLLNNSIFVFTDQGVATVSDTGISIISRPIENLLLRLITGNYPSFSTATWAFGSETSRAYFLYTVLETDDTLATQCFRYNTFTQTWTRLDLSKTCGIVGPQNRNYLAASDINYLEVERYDNDRFDYADREYTTTLPSSSVTSDGLTVSPSSITNITAGDVLAQVQYVNTYQFNRLLKKLDNDYYLSDSDYFTSLGINEPGKNIFQAFSFLVSKLNSDDASRVSYTFNPTDVNTATDEITVTSHGLVDGEIVRVSSTGTLPSPLLANTVYYVSNATANTFKLKTSPSSSVINLSTQGSGVHTVTNNYNYVTTIDFENLQVQFNNLIKQLNVSEGCFWNNYEESIGTTVFETVVKSVEKTYNRLQMLSPVEYLQGPLIVYKGYACVVEWVPQTLGDPSLLKQVREATIMFESNDFYGGTLSFRSDLSRGFENIDFNGFGLGLWGGFEWGNTLWGGEGAAIPVRVLIPQQKQRCRYMDTKFTHINAREKFSIYGMSLTFEASSTRAYR